MLLVGKLGGGASRTATTTASSCRRTDRGQPTRNDRAGTCSAAVLYIAIAHPVDGVPSALVAAETVGWARFALRRLSRLEGLTAVHRIARPSQWHHSTSCSFVLQRDLGANGGGPERAIAAWLDAQPPESI